MARWVWHTWVLAAAPFLAVLVSLGDRAAGDGLDDVQQYCQNARLLSLVGGQQAFLDKQEELLRQGRRALDEQIESLDLHFVLDMSSSISVADARCRAASGNDCWESAALFVFNVTQSVLPQVKSGWALTEFDPNGLRFNVDAFSCRQRQGVPISHRITGKTDPMRSSRRALCGTIFALVTDYVPYGGTCPSQALGYQLELVESAKSDRIQTVVILTDGVINPLDIAATRTVSSEIADRGAQILVASIGDSSGWTDQLVQDIFGSKAVHVQVNDFDNLSTMAGQLGREIVDASKPVPDSDSNPFNQDKATNSDGNAMTLSSWKGDGAAGAASVIGLFAVLSILVAAAVTIKRRQRHQ